jgi:hypothetical protein
MAMVRIRPRRRSATVLAVLSALLFLVPRTEAIPEKEYQVKAAFLFNFAQFVQWPDSLFPDKDSPLVVGILGEDPFDSYLDEVVRGEKVNGRPIEVVRYRSVGQVKNCHILYIGASEERRVAEVLKALGGRQVLTVGESDLFPRKGGMVSMVNRQGRIRLSVNLQAIKSSELGVSSKLLQLAEIVPPEGG